jgi:tungstate transport system substrate-binding protein
MQDSGLFEHILPLFKAKSGIDVKVVAQPTGQALDTGRRGGADVVFVHAKSAEEKFIAEGFGVKRYPVMYNDFVLIGPKSDPAGIKDSKDIVAALRRLKAMRAPFITRGDRSGTNIAELDLWKLAGIDISAEKGSWYIAIDQGMGGALTAASAVNAYVISDRGCRLRCTPERLRPARGSSADRIGCLKADSHSRLRTEATVATGEARSGQIGELVL